MELKRTAKLQTEPWVCNDQHPHWWY